MGSLVIDRLDLEWRWTVVCAVVFVIVCWILIVTFIQPYPERYGIDIEEKKEEKLLENCNAGNLNTYYI